MKKLLMALLVAACAVGAQAADVDAAAPAWKSTLKRVFDLGGDMGIAGFMKKSAPAYITGDFAEADRPESKPLSANRNGYYDADLKWHGGYFDENGAFVKGHEVKTLFGMPYGVGQLIMIPLCLIMMYLAIVKGFEPRRTPRQLPARGRHRPRDDARRRHLVSRVRHSRDVRRHRRARRVPLLLLQVRHRHGRVSDHDLHGRRRDDGLRSPDRQPQDGAPRRRGAVRHLLRALRGARPRCALRRGLLRRRRPGQGRRVHRHHRRRGRPDRDLAHLAPRARPPRRRTATWRSSRSSSRRS